MENVRKISKKYYLKEILACFLVSCLFFNAPVALAEVVMTSNPVGTILVNPVVPAVGDYAFTQGMSASDGSIGEFSNFDIASNLFVTCTQPSTTSNALFKVNSVDGTQMLGRFDATGNVYLRDGAGFFIGSSGIVNANRFVASSLDIDNGDWQDFIGGTIDKLKFGPLGVEDPRSAVENQGTITAPDGVYLVGAQVLNSGTINSDLVVMAAGEKVYLTHGDSKVYVEMPSDLFTPDPAFNKVDNSGTIAAGAQVLLAAGDIFSTAMNVSSLAATANRDITLTGAVQTEGDMELVADFDGSGGASGGTMWAQSTLTSTAGSIDISASDDTIDLDDDVTADVDLTLNNDTTAAPGITLTAGQNVDIATGKILTAEGTLTIEATAGEIMAETSIIDMDADGETLTLTQNASMDMEEDFVVDNRSNTDLFADSTGGSVTSDAAGEWQSVGGHAAENITLSDISEVITTKSLTTDNGDITIDSQQGKVEAYGAISAGRDVKITATDESSDSILLRGAGRSII
ncbi:MAG: filamentous hemagglutinin N-terminal domain-containing protein, partial [Planctomycetota bacterium]